MLFVMMMIICFYPLCFVSVPAPVLVAKYKPKPDKSIEELLYSGDANPHPILDIAEQLLAMRASGSVKVYVQKNDDIAALRKVLKVCVYSAYSIIT